MRTPGNPGVAAARTGQTTRELLLTRLRAGGRIGRPPVGFDTAVISGTTDALRTRFALSDNLLGFTVASALIGTIIGAFGAGRPADAIGRRGALGILGVIYFVASLGCLSFLGPGLVPGVPLHRGTGGRGRVGGFAALHRGNLAGLSPGPHGGHHAVQHSLGYPAGVRVELYHRRAAPGRQRMALDVRE